MTQYAKNANKILNTTPALKPDVPYPGKCLTFTDEFTATTSDAYVIAAVQKCDIVVGGWIAWTAATNSQTISVGDDRDCARYMTATSAQTSASITIFPCGIFNAINGLGFQHTGSCNIFVSINTGGTGSNSLFRSRVDIIRP